MYTVGFIDNSFDLLLDYQKRLQRHAVALIYPRDDINSKEKIVQWILEENISCLMVDYRLIPDYEFSGTDLVAYINGILPDLPCIVLTAYPQESLNENLVIGNIIEDRSALDATDLTAFVAKLKQAVEVFTKRLELREEEYRNLLERKNAGTISAQQEERFVYLYQLLRAYGEIDELPIALLHHNVADRVDSLIGKIDELIADINSGKEG